MWHISNELHGECLCPLCLAAFRDWLRRKYETLDALNLAYWANFWAHRITAWEQIDPRDDTLDGGLRRRAAAHRTDQERRGRLRRRRGHARRT